MSPTRLTILSSLAAGALALGLAAGCGSSSGSDETPGASTGDALEALGPVLEAYDLLRQEYVNKDELTDDVLRAAAIRGMIEALGDPYSSYLSPDQFEFSGDFDGEFEGIGASVDIFAGQLVIVEPLPNSPALEAGIQPLDLVLSVDGKSVTGMTLMEAVLLVRGPKGSSVVLEVVHQGEREPEEITIVRDTIVMTSARGRVLEPEIGYIRLSEFQEHTPEQLRDALSDLKEQEVRGLILDLRYNNGGLLSKAVDVASEFLASGNVLTTVDPNGEEEVYAVNPVGTALDIPLVVLVNGSSISSAEIVAAALQDHERALVVGSRTFGKGSVSTITPLSDGAGLNIINSRWFTPNGRALEGVGLEPDILVGTDTGLPNTLGVRRLQRLLPAVCAAYGDASLELRARPDMAEALEQLCNLPTQPPPATLTDIQLERAVEVLKEQL